MSLRENEIIAQHRQWLADCFVPRKIMDEWPSDILIDARCDFMKKHTTPSARATVSCQMMDAVCAEGLIHSDNEKAVRAAGKFRLFGIDCVVDEEQEKPVVVSEQ